MTNEDAVARLLQHDPTLFKGDTAAHALGWLDHPERYLSAWLDETAARLPARYARTILLGMGGSSSPARLYADALGDTPLQVLDTSNPDTIDAVDFSGATVIASSKSGNTIETQTLLAHALANGLDPSDLVVVTDPGTLLAELGASLDATVVLGDPDTGGRFSSLSPFGLVPALYAGWTPDSLREELGTCELTHDLAVRALNHADAFAHDVDDGMALFSLGADPIDVGGALWLEQLVAETTGKEGRGFVPVLHGRAQDYAPRDMMYWHLVAALLARHLDVDPFNQPNVESAKKDVFSLLEGDVEWTQPPLDRAMLHDALGAARYNTLQVYAPLSTSSQVAQLRVRVEAAFGVTTANLGPRYLHSTGQLHKGGPDGVVGVQIVQRPTTTPVRIEGRGYTFHDLHMAQALSDERAMRSASRSVWRLIVDDMDEAAQILGV